ncbi:MAG: DUF2842 domain-containing protein [Pseudolabrys sp.]|jgi:TRAP-type C4-dicarboxylate transport system permease small subunit|nr:DUF2842 domain-containing protein [Pseudolabrys sp.]
MSVRLRKLIGTFGLLLLVAAWSLMAMALAQSVLADVNGLPAAVYYVVVGLGWVVPAMALVKWMAGPMRRQSRRPSRGERARPAAAREDGGGPDAEAGSSIIGR